MRRARDYSGWFDKARGAEMPVLHPKQVSANSALRLKDSTQYVVAEPDEGGLSWLIKSQHRGEKAAKQALKSWPRNHQVLRVSREEAQNE